MKREIPMLVVVLLGVATPVLAETSRPINPAQEYVEARVKEMNARVFGDGADAPGVGSRIVGGKRARLRSNPFQVALLWKAEPDTFDAQYCGGTLVKSNFIVTAAHCSDFVAPGVVQVLTGTRRLDGTGVRRDVVAIRIHPLWNSQTFHSDIAVWELASDVPDVEPATLPTQDPVAGQALLVTGWGNMSSVGAAFPIDLMQVKVAALSRPSCRNVFGTSFKPGMICAGSSDRDACQGDSGGPLTVKRGTAFSELTGITSWGVGCAQPGFPGVYTRVSRYVDFVREIID